MIRKIILLILFSLTVSSTVLACEGREIKKSGFLYYKDGKGKFIEGYDIENPQDKIIMVFNRGSWHVKKGSRFCIQKNNSMQSVLAQLSGTIIDGKELVVWINMELWKAGLYTHENNCVKGEHMYKGKKLYFTPPYWKCMWGPPTYIKKVKTSKDDILQVPEYVSNFPLKNRAAINSAIADIFVEKGTPRNQLFISGHSCGGIGSLRMEAVFPEVYNAAISLNPNCWDNIDNDLMREFQLDEIRGAEKLDALTFHGEMDGASSYLGISSYMRWIGDKPGAEWVELPVHNSPNGKEFIINGVECKIKYRMNSGWKIKHNWDYGHKKKAWTIIDPKEKAEMKKKAAGHNIASDMCFTPYLEDIKKFIAKKL